MRRCQHGRACKEPPTVVKHPNFPAQYHIRDLVGKGGFARVYTVVQHTPDQPPQPVPTTPAPSSNAARRGEHGSLSATASKSNPSAGPNSPEYRLFALKVISKCHLADTATGREALRNEVSIHRQLQHPAIVKLVSYWEDQNRIYLLMDYVNGPELEQYVKLRGRLTEAEASQYTANIFEALSYLHANRIIHRDLKLANILLSHNLNRVMLCDFGLATHLDTLRSGKNSSVCGTPNYVAPELLTPSVLSRLTPRRTQAQFHKSSSNKGSKGGNPKDIGYTTSADSWSMGVVLYTMLVGSGPFDGEDIKKTFNRIRTARFTFPIGLKLSANAKSLIRSLLSEDHTKRPSADQALRHPFFTTRSIPKLVPLSSNPGLISDKGIIEHSEDAICSLNGRDHRSDRADGNRDSAMTRSRRAGFRSRRESDVRRWSGSYPSLNRHPEVGPVSETVQDGIRRDRPSSLRNEPSSHNFIRTLPRPARERSSSLSASHPVERTGSRSRRSSLNTKTMDGTNVSPHYGVSNSSRHSSLRFSDRRSEVLNLSVTLSAALLWSRKILDDSHKDKSGPGKAPRFETVAKRLDSVKAPPLVRRWADYTRKHGFATMMDDGRTSICFNDGSIMFFLSPTATADIPEFAYIPPRGMSITAETNSSGITDGDSDEMRSKDISKKACLCNVFADLMNDGGRGSMYDLALACNVSFLKPEAESMGRLPRSSSGEDHKDVVHVREWARFRDSRAAAFRLSNHSIHVKFDVGEDRCDDYLFNLTNSTLFYREAKTGESWECSVKNLGQFSALSEDIHHQLALCANAIARFLE